MLDRPLAAPKALDAEKTNRTSKVPGIASQGKRIVDVTTQSANV
jgi:hypothetical protein